MNEITRRIERRIVRRLVSDALKAGYRVLVDDGDEEHGPFTNVHQVMRVMFYVSSEHLVFRKKGSRPAWVFLVYGNQGWDVMNDYTISAETITLGASKLADRYCDYLESKEQKKSELIRQNSY